PIMVRDFPASCCNSISRRASTVLLPTFKPPSRGRRDSFPSICPALPPSRKRTRTISRSFAMVSDTATEGQLYDYANTQVGERISILPGVSQVAIYGTQSAVRIKADPSKMAVRNITLEDLTNAIKNGTAYTGAGQFDGPNRTFLLQPQGQLMTADQY